MGRATLRVEFRYQQFRNEIKGIAKEFLVEPDIDWKEFSFRIDSPASTGDPSREPWQIILRVMSDVGTLECDDVRLSTTSIDLPE